MRIRRAIFPFLIALRLLVPAFTQTTPHPTPANPADYSQEAAVIEHYGNRVTFEADGSSVREINTVVKVQADAGVQDLAVLKFAYTSSNETIDVDYVRVRKPDGTVVNTPAYNIQDLPADLTREAPMYSDIHEKHITVKALGVGDTLEYLIRYRTTKPEIPGQFWYAHNFIKDSICKDEILEINVPKDKYVNVSSTDVQPQIREESGRRIYTWKSSNLVRKEVNKKEIPRRETPRPSVEVTSFHSWDEVGAWYATLQKDQLTVTPDVQKKAAEITKGLTTDDEKIHALYAYVSTHFHYVSLSFGIGRYQPHAADDVLGNEYGDCKDKHTLLATLLKAEGIDAWPALINSSRKIDDDLPAPSSFDHVITVVPRGSQMIWLDTTPEVGPFGFLFTGLRGKEALVIPTNKPAVLMKTPDTMPFPLMDTFTAEAKLSADGVLTGHMVRVLRGDSEVLMRIGYRRVPQAKWQELTQNISYATNFAGDVSNVKVTAPEDTGKPFEMSYDYTRKHYADWDNHRIVPPFPPLGIEVANTDERRPVEPFLLGAIGEIKYHAKVELPPSMFASVPPDVDISEDFAEYHAGYRTASGVLYADRRLVIKKTEVPVADWDKYVKLRKAISDDEDRFIDLQETDTDAREKTPTLTPSPSTGNSEAAQKIAEAQQAMNRHDVSRAFTLLHEVLQLDPNQEGVHAMLGWLYMARNQRTDALAELLKEEDLHPNYPVSYSLAALVYINALPHDNDKAIEQLRKYLKLQPGNTQALAQLSSLLVQQGKCTEAIALLEPAVEAKPFNDTLQPTLVDAYLKNGDTAKALALVDKTFTPDSDPIALNNVAYELAEAGVGLAKAKELALASVKGVGASTFKSDLTENAALAYTSEIDTTWDTLGWVYFRMGDYQQAFSYIHAAWLLGQDPDEGDHLGQIYQKLGKTKDAEHTYQLALANAAPGKTHDDISHQYKLLTGKAPSTLYASQRRPDGSWTPTPPEELSRMRTIKLPGTSNQSGSATFAIAFVFGKVEDVAYIEGQDEFKPFVEKLKAAKFDVAFPENGVPVRIVRRGILSCHSGTCDFALLPVHRS